MSFYLFVIQFNLQLIHILVSSKVYTQCDFYIIPSMTIQDICHNPELNIASFPKYTGTLEASFTEHIGNKGTFKTAHSGKILEMHPCAPISKFASYVPAADHFNPKNALVDVNGLYASNRYMNHITLEVFFTFKDPRRLELFSLRPCVFSSQVLFSIWHTHLWIASRAYSQNFLSLLFCKYMQ